MWMRTLSILGAALSCGAQTDLISFNPEANLRLDSNAESAVFSSDGTRVAVATKSGAFVGDAQSGVVRPFAPGSVRAIAISRDDKRLAAGNDAGRL